MDSTLFASSQEHSLFDLERFSFALKAARIGSWDLNIEKQQVWWDERCRELYGFGKEQEVSYDTVLDCIHPEDLGRVKESIEKTLHSQAAYDIAFRTVGAQDHLLRWVQCKGEAYVNQQGQAIRFSGIIQDISSFVEIREQLEAQQRHWRSLVDHSGTATAIYQGREMRIQAVNQAMIRIWGKDESVRGKTFDEALPEVADQPFLTLLQGVYDTGVAYYTPEGPATLNVNGRLQEFWFTYSYVPLKNERGDVCGIVHTATDITQQVHARRSLEVQQQQFKALMEGSLLLKILLDPKGNITFQNQRYAQYTGLTLEESQKKGWQNLFHPGAYDEIISIVLKGFTRQENFRIEARLRSSKGEYCWHEIEFVPLFDEHQQLSGWVCRATNIHEQKTLQQNLEYLVQERTQELEASLEELQALNEELAASNEEILATSDELFHKSELLEKSNAVLQQQSQELAALNEELQATSEELSEFNQQLSLSNDRLQRFAYVASHDLQEPLRKIQTFSSLLSSKYDQALGEQGLSLLSRMSKAGEQMSVLIQDLLVYSRMSSEPNQFQVVSLKEVMSRVMDTLEVSIEQTKAEIKIDVLPAVIGDELQLSQLFQNLLSNALKFVKPGQPPQIHISAVTKLRQQLPAHLDPISKAHRFYQISVMDQGIGFDEQFLDRIFEVFQRLNDKQQYEGTGIGLAICQRVMENHGGAITAESQPGQGASFQVYFPA